MFQSFSLLQNIKQHIQTYQKYQRMLTPNTAQSLGLKGDFSQFSLNMPSFQGGSPLWQKNKQKGLKFNKSNRFQFFKYGKSLGMEVTRYLQYCNGVLYYFQSENDKEPKGFCILQNLYFYYFMVDKRFVMHLTNTHQFSTFYFNDNNFYLTYAQQIMKYVIQVDFHQKYQMMEQIGEGTFSKVYAAYNRFTNKIFAIKVMPKMDQNDYLTKNLATQEKKVLKFTNTTHLCHMEQFFQDNYNYIFVLQFINGQDLNKTLKEQKLMATNENIFILKQILKGLEQLHYFNIIHRDLKPHNIIFEPKQKKVKIVDFGLSLLLDNNNNIKQFMRCGTMGYIAPEIVNNQTNNRKPYDCKSDMFAFGIISHMLLLGTNPLRGRSYRETVDRNINCNFNLNQKQILLKYGRDCLELFQGCFNKNPNHRPTASEALKNKFFQQKRKDQQTVTNLDLMNEHQIFGTKKIEQINYLQDKQLVGNNTSQIYSPKKTLPTGHSLTSASKISGFSNFM